MESKEIIRHKLVHALTAYDIKQSKKKFHNPYALGHYFKAVEDVMQSFESGTEIRTALEENFCGSVLRVCFKALDIK